MDVGRQVITIFAGTTGLVDDVPVHAVNGFIDSFLQWLSVEHGNYISEINESKKLSNELAASITAAMNDYKKTQTGKGDI
jgi:F-type H+/Na+-transporting ATPase subunit alpha